MTVGYGRETWCYGSYQPGRFASGWQVLAQALYRRLITPRGTLRGEDESTYGLELAGYIGSVGLETATALLPVLIQAEFLKDDRVESVSASVSSAADDTIELEIEVVPVDELEDFTLTLAVSDVETRLLGAVAA